MKKIYYISSREVVDGIIHEATVIKETAKTYIAEIDGYEHTLRKTDMSFGYCDGWENPCGHVDKYDAVRDEAASNGLNPHYAEGGL